MDVRFYNLIPYPGTELFNWVRDNNYFVKQPEDYLNDASGFSTYPVFETPELPYQSRIKLMERLDKVAKKVRKNAIRNKLKAMGLAGIIAYYLLGNIYVSDSFQTLMRQNKIIRRILDAVYSMIRRKERSR